jgi:hypothetical protein
MGMYPGPGAGILLPRWDDELERVTHEVIFVHHQISTGTRLHPCYCPTEAELEALRSRGIWVRRVDTCFRERWYLTREQASYVATQVRRVEPVIIYHGRSYDCIRLVRDPGRYTLHLPVPSIGPFAYLVNHNLPVPPGMPIPSEDGFYGPEVIWFHALSARGGYPSPEGDLAVLCPSCSLRILTRRERRRTVAAAGEPSCREIVMAPEQLPLFACTPSTSAGVRVRAGRSHRAGTRRMERDRS